LADHPQVAVTDKTSTPKAQAVLKTLKRNIILPRIHTYIQPIDRVQFFGRYGTIVAANIVLDKEIRDYQYVSLEMILVLNLLTPEALVRPTSPFSASRVP
jgi:hypothetical protein